MSKIIKMIMPPTSDENKYGKSKPSEERARSIPVIVEKGQSEAITTSTTISQVTVSPPAAAEIIAAQTEIESRKS
jgi:hypothetical protein